MSRAASLLGLLGIARALDLTGAGASFPDKMYHFAVFAYGQTPVAKYLDLSIKYVSTGSGIGKCLLTNSCDASDKAKMALATGGTVIDSVDFAGSDSLVTDDEYSKYPDIQMYPTVAGAVVPIVHFGEDGKQEVVLSPGILAKIYSGAIRRWDDAKILALNPSLSVPASQSIRVIARSDKSGTTETWKRSLAAFDANFSTAVGTSPTSSLRAEGAQGWPPSEEFWPGFEYRDQNSGVAAAVAALPYSIGYCSTDAVAAAPNRKYVVAALDKGFDDAGVPSGNVLSPSTAAVQAGTCTCSTFDERCICSHA